MSENSVLDEPYEWWNEDDEPGEDIGALADLAYESWRDRCIEDSWDDEDEGRRAG
ncbi:hypothetical protein [Schaalia sp. lx-100]|uniref:hypothetical protein n=1 Tax=Schaalia sp. lx-100 TaxID=2899081 RepID=UPI001E599B3B|nr:hypothetical protein [Schaalia sp. lx-100]MCD4557634.1 hypothetical protein [Schaalia sp. lx-100]